MCFCVYQQAFKSLCYEVLPFVFDDKLGKNTSVVIVVSPLISLMLDQVRSLRSTSVRATMMSSGRSKVDKELLATDEHIRECSLLFCAPEAIDTSKWRETIAEPDVSSRVVVAIVVDDILTLVDPRTRSGRVYSLTKK